MDLQDGLRYSLFKAARSFGDPDTAVIVVDRLSRARILWR